jgi:excinuclease ABC subunit C
MSSLQLGISCISSFLEHLPQTPGVYRMIGVNGKVLYVGKAKNLAKRVAQYTDPKRLSDRIARMVAQTISMEFTHVQNELDALLLEANLIKNLQPRYNILLKDNKSFPLILLSKNHQFPRISKHRGARKIDGWYFGPYPSAAAVNRSIIDVQKAFGLRPCNDIFFSNRQRACMEYQIKRCSGPCVGHISAEDYAERTKQALDFLSGKKAHIQNLLAQKMQEASNNLDFESAANYRDRIRALTQIQSHQQVDLSDSADADLFAIYAEQQLACVQVFFFRNGQNLGNQAFFLELENDDCAQALELFISQFYQHKIPAKQVIISHLPENAEIFERALSHWRDARVQLIKPERGEKKSLLDQALRNAHEALLRKYLQQESTRQHLVALAEILSLTKTPNRIEVYDNSHIQGSHDLGAMIVASKDGFEKRQYRRFNIKGEALASGDDYAMMREVLQRRFAKLAQETIDKSEENRPDLVIIDGGKGQWNIAAEVLKNFSLNIPILGIAKGKDRNAGNETFIFPDGSERKLPLKDPRLFYLQRLRDEAHRFAIEGHRKRRSSAITSSQLDVLTNIGKARKRALLLHFGSVEAIRQARIEDFKSVAGISKKMAESILKELK